MRTEYTYDCDICHWKDETGVFQFLDASAHPLDTKCLLHMLEMFITTCRCPKGILGLGRKSCKKIN